MRMSKAESGKKRTPCPHGLVRAYFCVRCWDEHEEHCARLRERGEAVVERRFVFCDHRRQRNQCRECSQANFCEHGARRSRCSECRLLVRCAHGLITGDCGQCLGRPADAREVPLCLAHGRVRSECTECGGASLCPHGKMWARCKEAACRDEGEFLRDIARAGLRI